VLRRKPWLLGAIALSTALLALATACVSEDSGKVLDTNTNGSVSGSSAVTTKEVRKPSLPIPPPSGISQASTDKLPSMGFWAVWGPASRNRSDVQPIADQLVSQGFSAGVIYTTEWENLSLSPWYIVFIGPYGTRPEADKALKAAESVGYQKFIIKFSGMTTIDNNQGYVRSGVTR
jgi:septal ring-binding cell division protein DamX